MNTDSVPVFRARDETTANIVRLSLEDAGIDAVVRPYHTSWFDGIFVAAEGAWGEVVVRREDAEQALALLKESGKESEKDSQP